MKSITYLYYSFLSNFRETKVCSRCGLPKSLDNFCKWNKSRDGFNYACKKCVMSEYRRRKELERSYLKKDRSARPESIDFKGMNTKGLGIFSSERDKQILNDIMWCVQSVYGVTLTEMRQKFRNPSLVFPRDHFFWFVNYYKRISECDAVPFEPTNRFASRIVNLDHSTFWHGVRVINLMHETDKFFGGLHMELFDLMERKLAKYKLNEN